MKIDIKKWTFKKGDHLWLEDSNSDMYINNNVCDGCGSEMNEIAKIINSNNSGGLITGICPSCGYVKRTRNLPQSWYEEHFAKRWLAGNNKKISDQQILAEDYYIFNKLAKYIPKKGNILDAGCGIGQRLLPFYNNGYEVFGFDPSEERTKTASEVMSNIEVNSAEKYFPSSNQIFDLIFFFNVLQFTENPFDIIRNASEKLEDGGLLFFSVGQFYNDANFCQFSHIGLIRSFISLFSMTELFKELDLWPVEYSESPMEILLQKGIKRTQSQEIIDDAKKVTEEDIEKYIKKTLQMNRLKFFGITNIKYKGRKITIKKRGRYSNMLPVIFKHDNIDLPILLK